MQVFRSRRSVERSLLTLGIGLVLAAIVGGGLGVAGFEVPLVSSVVRQILLAVLGVAVAGLSLWVKSDEAPERRVEDEAPHVTRTRSRRLVAAMPNEVVIDQPTEVWAQVCLPTSVGFVEDLPQYTSSGEEIGKDDAKRFPGSVQFTEREGRLMNALLSVKATSQDFRVVNEMQTISLSPGHDSGVLVFEVVPTKVAAPARVLVSVTQQQDGVSVTVAVASVMTRVKPTGQMVPLPAPARVPWNVTRQGAFTGGFRYEAAPNEILANEPEAPNEILANEPEAPRSDMKLREIESWIERRRQMDDRTQPESRRPPLPPLTVPRHGSGGRRTSDQMMSTGSAPKNERISPAPRRRRGIPVWLRVAALIAFLTVVLVLGWKLLLA
jgi:hypothetical protein